MAPLGPVGVDANKHTYTWCRRGRRQQSCAARNCLITAVRPAAVARRRHGTLSATSGWTPRPGTGRSRGCCRHRCRCALFVIFTGVRAAWGPHHHVPMLFASCRIHAPAMQLLGRVSDACWAGGPPYYYAGSATAIDLWHLPACCICWGHTLHARAHTRAHTHTRARAHAHSALSTQNAPSTDDPCGLFVNGSCRTRGRCAPCTRSR